MKKSTYLLTLLLTALFCLPWGGAMAADPVQVGTKTSSHRNYAIIDFYNLDGGSLTSDIVYTAAQLTAAGLKNGDKITKLTFKGTAASAKSLSSSQTLTAWVALKTGDITWNSPDKTSMQEIAVFTAGQMSFAKGVNEIDIPLNSSIIYDGTSDLRVYFEATSGSWIDLSFDYDGNYQNMKWSNGVSMKYNPLLYVTLAVEGPALEVFNGSAKMSSGENFSFGLANAGTTKTFTLSNPGTESVTLNIAATNDFAVAPANVIIAAGGEETLTVTMPSVSATGAVTITPTASGLDAFVINVSGTIKDPSRLFDTLLGGALPQDWTTSGTWYWNTTNGAYNTTYYESNNYRLITPQLVVAEGETFFFDAKGTYNGYQGVKFEYSADGTTWTASATTTTLSSDWQTFEISDIPAGTYYIALHGWQVNLRNFYGGLLPAKPKDLNLVSKTSSSLTLDWTPAGSETAWILQYSTDGTNWSSNVPVNAKPFELSGLNAGTKYYVRVKANVADSEWSAVASFVTECGDITATSWTYNFNDDETNGYPVCWDRITYYDSFDGVYYPMVTTSSAYDGKSLMFYGGGEETASSATLPPFSTPIKDLVISFNYKSSVSSSYSKYGKLVVGYMTDPADANTFVEVETLDQSASYIEAGPIAFAGAPDNARITIRYANGTSDYGAAYVDNLVVEEAPSCMKPGKPAAATASLTANSAVVTWTAGGSESAWKLQYKAEGGDWSEEIAVEGVASYTLTPLTATTTYYVRVKAICGSEDVSDWSSVGEFTTPCGTMSMPFEENFSSSSAYPACWNASPNTGNYRWTPYSEYVSSISSYNYEIRLRGSNASSELSTPSIALSEDAVLKFRWKNGSSTKINANVYISTDGGATRELLPNDLSTKVTSWTNKTIDLSDYTGETVIIYFVSATGNSTSSYAYLDDVQVIAKPCEALAAPTAAPTMDGGTISWTGNAKALRYQAVGASTWNAVAVTGTSYLLTGLAASASYNVQVQAECATGDDDVWSASLTFATRCAATDELPYSKNFDVEESEEMPDCWSKISATEYPYVVSGAAAYGGSGKALYFLGSAEQIAVLPALTADLSTLTFSLYYKGSSANFQLGYVKADGVTFVALETLPALTAFGAEPYELDLTSIPAEAKYLAIRYTNSSNYASGYVDNVVVKKTPTCFKPASIAASAITANSATVAWTASGKGETQYQYVYVPAGSTPDWAAATLTNELSATVSELEPTTAYDFYVRSYCDTEDQSDAVKASFTTMCAAAALPFEENFDAVADYDMAACWNVYAATYYSAYVANGQLRADAPKTNATVIVLPKLEVSSFAGLAVTFSYSVSNGTLEVGYVTDAEDVSTFTAVGDALTATANTDAVVPLTAGNGNVAFRFKGNTGDGDLWLDNVRVARTEIFSDTEDNASRFAALAAAGETIDVVFNRTMLYNGDYNTLCLPFSLSAAQLANSPLSTFNIKSYDYATIENEELLISIAGAGSIEAGVPYFVANRNNEANKSVQLYKDVVITASTPGKIDNSDVTFQGVFNPVDLAAQTESDSHNELFLAAGNMIYWPAQNKTVKGFRAYFQVKTGGPLKIRKGMPARIVEQANTATGINDIQGDHVQSTKMLVNGQVIIIRNGVKYSITGQKIQ